MIPSAYIAHQMEHRTRIRIPSRRNSISFFSGLERELSLFDGVEKVQSNPRSASVLVTHKGAFDAIASFSKSHNLFIIKKEKQSGSTEPWTYPISERISELDQRLKASTRGRWDIPTVSATGIIGLSILQMFRRQWLPPAWTLLSEAVAIIAAQHAHVKAKAKEEEGRQSAN